MLKRCRSDVQAAMYSGYMAWREAVATFLIDDGQVVGQGNRRLRSSAAVDSAW